MASFGIALAAYELMLAEQGGVCAICQQPPKKQALSVDHDHTTGRIRGLLCQSCNTGIGLLQDDPSILRVAITYLEETKNEPMQQNSSC